MLLALVQSLFIMRIVGHLASEVVVSCPALDRQMQGIKEVLLSALVHQRQAELDVYGYCRKRFERCWQ